MNMSLDEAIQHCHEAAARMRMTDPCSTCADEHNQLACWLEELKQVRAERDAAVADLRKLVPAWRWDGKNQLRSESRLVLSQSDRVEFG